ncbi:MAG: hypothetical protein GXW85_04550 [Clostridia bacterium]|nr:hypothetical protein [Clostridia bacterium]
MKRIFIIGSILLLLSVFFLYHYYPYYQISKINKSIDVASIMLLMPLEEVTVNMGEEGEYIYGMGGFGYEYEHEKMRIFFSNDSDGLSYKKVCFIETENSKHSVLDIHPGDTLAKTFSVLEKSGFKQERQYYFKSGDIYINLTPENGKVKKIRIGFVDRSLKGRVY